MLILMKGQLRNIKMTNNGDSVINLSTNWKKSIPQQFKNNLNQKEKKKAHTFNTVALKPIKPTCTVKYKENCSCTSWMGKFSYILAQVIN